MPDPEGDIVLIHKAELEELRKKGAAFGEQILAMGEQPQVRFTIKQEKDYRYWVILLMLGIVVGIGILTMLQWNTVMASVREARETTNQMCENVWNLLDQGLAEPSAEPTFDFNPGAPEELAP